MTNRKTHDIDANELVELLIDNGFGKLVSVMMDEEMYTRRKGRLNKSKLCRTLKIKPTQLNETLKICRSLLDDSFCDARFPQ